MMEQDTGWARKGLLKFCSWFEYLNLNFSYSRWRSLAQIELKSKIFEETKLWRKNDIARRREISRELMRKRKREEEQSSGDSLDLSALKAKLLRMGTNVSIATNTNKNSSSSNVAGVSVIGDSVVDLTKSCSNGKLENIESEEKKSIKPSCAVKPMVKDPKPSATVKPFIKTECVADLVKEEQSDNLMRDAGVNVVSGSNVQSNNSGCCSESRSSSRSSSVDSAPSRESSGNTDVSSRETSGGETDSITPPPPLVPQTPSEDDFNADIVCAHGNLRIEHKVRQLVSREAWNTLSGYFSKPITFQVV